MSDATAGVAAQHGAAISMRGLTKTYGTTTVVDGIDLEARPGEFLTLLGPSGSGKTTTLNMLAGFVDASGGDILVDGQSVRGVPPRRRNIGMVFQHYALFPHMTVAENVAYPLRQRRVPRARREQKVAEALQVVGLAGLGARAPKQLSGGQQQRVALARALVYDPRVLLMDEPLGALDKKLRDQLQLEIKRIHAELGTTFVFVTHDQDEALVLSDRIAVFNEGRIEQVGPAQDLYDRPDTRFVAQFLGESTMLTGRLRAPGELESALGTFRATRSTVDTVGAAACLAVRPERIRVVVGDERPAGNAVAGTVRQTVFLGNARRIEVALADGSGAVVREAALLASPASVGDRVWLTFDPDDATVLADHPSPAAATPSPAHA